MSITIVQKSDLTKKKLKAPKALVLAGGAITGGSFKAGGVKALNDYFTNFSVNDFDIFVGISSGSIIAVPLVGGLTPESVLRSLDGTSKHFSRLSAWHFYRPNFEEFMARPIAFAVKAAAWLPATLAGLVRSRGSWMSPLFQHVTTFIKSPSAKNYDDMMEWLREHVDVIDFPSLMSLVPTGVFDNRPIEEYLRRNIQHNNLTNSFKVVQRLTGKRLYICAVELDGARPVIFGPDERSDLTISEAVMASTAVPGFYKPARIRGVDYVDGMVYEAANIDIAVKKGAQLIICYNPFRPYEADTFVDAVKQEKDLLSRGGIFAVMYQIIRAALHSRLTMSMEQFKKDPAFKGDIILIEPPAHDLTFSELNPLFLSNRIHAAQLGFETTHASIAKQFPALKRILASYGIEMDKKRIEQDYRTLRRRTTTPDCIQDILEGRSAARNRPPVKKKQSPARRTRK